MLRQAPNARPMVILSDKEPDLAAIDAAAVSIVRDWLMGDRGREEAAGTYYLARLAGGHFFVEADLEIASYCRRQFKAGTLCFELGFGFGELSILLALSGHRAIGYESVSGRHAGARALVEGLTARGIDIGDLSLVLGLFPNALELAAFDSDLPAVFVSSNVTGTHVQGNFAAIVRALRLFDHLVIDLARFGAERDRQAKGQLLIQLQEIGFEEVTRVYEKGETDIRHLRNVAAVGQRQPPKGEADGQDAMPADRPAFDPFEVFASYFSLAGSIKLQACPVCESRRITPLWTLPQSRLKGSTYLAAPGEAHNNTYLDYLPLLTVPQEIFRFDMCGDCHSVFRNPKDDDQQVYGHDVSKVEAFKRDGLDAFRGLAGRCEALFPPDTHFVVDAACGSGQVLALLKAKRPDLRLFGLDLSRPSVDWIKGLGIEAAVTDLDLDDLDTHVASGTVDFIVFNEAFEHVRSPLLVLRKLFRMLRVGGRLHFTAQYFGPESTLQVRVGEPIYIDRFGLDWVIDQLGAELVELKIDSKYRVTLAKKC